MHKVEVGNLFVGIRYIWIKTKKSSITSGRRLHPLQSTEKAYRPIDIVKGIKVGDILRNDALPFMTRPKPILKKDERGWIYIGKDNKPIKLYEPLKLESGYWILRKTG